MKEIVEDIKNTWCAPYLVGDRDGVNINGQFDCKTLLSNPLWYTHDIKSIAKDLSYTDDKLLFGAAFSQKYKMLVEDDARLVSTNWLADLKKAITHLNPRTLSGDILHIGSDIKYEPQQIHSNAKSVSLVDVSKELLLSVAQISRKSKAYHTRAEELIGIPSNSIDSIVALRVINSYHFNKKAAIRRFTEVLRPQGSLLLSVSNGYKALDDTIMPGQIVDTPPKINLFHPFEEALHMLQLLFKAGFHELFLVPGSTELFIGGTYIPHINNYDNPILHVESVDSIPLCFHSSLMPTAWLGNYSPYPIEVDSIIWPTVEHYFQSEKFAGSYDKELIRICRTPDEAKCLAWTQRDNVKGDWDIIRVDIMRRALKIKFEQHPDLKYALISTNKRELIERSQDDQVWGRSLKGDGENLMGTLLMEIREVHKNKSYEYIIN